MPKQHPFNRQRARHSSCSIHEHAPATITGASFEGKNANARAAEQNDMVGYKRPTDSCLTAENSSSEQWMIKRKPGDYMQDAVPQQGTWVFVTSLEHMPAMRVKAGSIPIFLEEQGTWIATFSRT